MTIHNIYIFDKTGILLYYNEWNRLKQTGMTREEVNLCNIFNKLLVYSIIGGQTYVWDVIFHQIFRK